MTLEYSDDDWPGPDSASTKISGDTAGHSIETLDHLGDTQMMAIAAWMTMRRLTPQRFLQITKLQEDGGNDDRLESS